MLLALSGSGDKVIFYVYTNDQSLPADPGKDVNYEFVKDATVRICTLLRKVQGAGGEVMTPIPWGAFPGEINWAETEDRFEAELKPLYAPKPREAEGSKRDAPLIPFSLEVKLSSEDVEKLSEATSLLFLIFPNKVTAFAAVVGDTLLLLDNLTGDAGLVIGYNPLLGVSYVVPQNVQDALAKVIVDIPQLFEITGFDNQAEALEAIANGELNMGAVKDLILPTVILGPAAAIPAAAEVLKNVGRELGGAADDLKNGVNNFLAGSGIQL